MIKLFGFFMNKKSVSSDIFHFSGQFETHVSSKKHTRVNNFFRSYLFNNEEIYILAGPSRLTLIKFYSFFEF